MGQEECECDSSQRLSWKVGVSRHNVPQVHISVPQPANPLFCMTKGLYGLWGGRVSWTTQAGTKGKHKSFGGQKAGDDGSREGRVARSPAEPAASTACRASRRRGSTHTWLPLPMPLLHPGLQRQKMRNVWCFKFLTLSESVSLGLGNRTHQENEIWVNVSEESLWTLQRQRGCSETVQLVGGSKTEERCEFWECLGQVCWGNNWYTVNKQRWDSMYKPG